MRKAAILRSAVSSESIAANGTKFQSSKIFCDMEFGASMRRDGSNAYSDVSYREQMSRREISEGRPTNLRSWKSRFEPD
jgi:hypothetical protein